MVISVRSTVAQWLSVRLGIEGLLVGESTLAESLCCVHEQDTSYAA